MSGSITPQFGTFIKVFVVLAILLGIEYIMVIIKLSLYDNHSVTWKIILGTLTPILIITSLVLSKITDSKAINIASIVLLAVVNLIYLLAPFATHLSRLIYNGNKNIIAMILIGVISILTSLLILVGLLGLAYWILRIMKL